MKRKKKVAKWRLALRNAFIIFGILISETIIEMQEIPNFESILFRIAISSLWFFIELKRLYRIEFDGSIPKLRNNRGISPLIFP